MNKKITATVMISIFLLASATTVTASDKTYKSKNNPTTEFSKTITAHVYDTSNGNDVENANIYVHYRIFPRFIQNLIENKYYYVGFTDDSGCLTFSMPIFRIRLLIEASANEGWGTSQVYNLGLMVPKRVEIGVTQPKLT